VIEKAKESLPRIHADDRGSEPENNSPQMDTDERRLELGNQEDRRHRATAPTSHVIGESQPEAEPNARDVTGREQQMNADQRGSERGWPEIAHEGTSNSGNSSLELHAEQMRPEVLLPELRGMRCVTRTILWALCAERTGRALEIRALEGGVAGQERNTGDHNFQNRWDRGDAGHEVSGTNEDWQNRRDRRNRTESRAIGSSTPAMPQHRDTCELRVPSCELHFPRRVLRGRPLLGAPLMRNGLMYEPVNEMGVVFLFGMMAERLGFWVESLQAGFPDCEAKLEVEPGRWQHVRIEFEFESRKFRDHRHDPDKCDMIVCWRHNWKGCPPGIQVVELRGMMQSPRSHVIADIADIGKNRAGLPRMDADDRGLKT